MTSDYEAVLEVKFCIDLCSLAEKHPIIENKY